MHFKQILIAASIALPTIAAPVPIRDSKIVVVDKMPPIESGDDSTALHKRGYGILIPGRWYCGEDDDQFEYVSAFGRNALGIPPYCKKDWAGAEDWKPRQREGEGEKKGGD